MAAKHKTHISHVDLDKAFANIRNYPGARTDRKVFKIIAEEANDEGVARFTTHMSKLLYRASGDDALFDSDGMSNSLYRLIRKGLIKGASYSFDNFHYPHGTVTIAPAYMLHTATQAADLAQDNADTICDQMGRLTEQKERIDKLEKLSDENATSVAASVMEIKRTQRNVEERIDELDKRMCAVEWALSAVAMLTVVGRVICLLRRR